MTQKNQQSEPSKEEIFDVLSSERRQHVLKYLDKKNDNKVEVGEVASHIASIEQDVQPEQVSSKERKTVYVALYQCHLPTMDKADAVNYNKPRGIIEKTKNTCLFLQHLYFEATNHEQNNGFITRLIKK